MSGSDKHKKIIDFVKSAKPRSTGHKVLSQVQLLKWSIKMMEVK